MKSIVITSNTSYSIYNFRLGLIRTLKENGFRVIVLAPEDNYTEDLKKECDFYRIKNLDRKGKNPVKDFMLFLEYLRYYRKLKPDIVLNYTIKPNIYSSLACGIVGIPAVSVVTGLGYVFLKGGILSTTVKFLYKLSFGISRYVVVQNPDDLNTLNKIISKNIKLIKGSGVNTDYFSPDFCKEKNNDRIIFLYFGRFLKDKGILELIEAGKSLWQERNDFEIWLVGAVDEGNPASLTQSEIEEISNFDFVKVFPFTKDIREYVCKSDCVVYPSYYREGIPRALLEAMSMGKPIITTDAPGCREVVVHGKNGFMVKPRDVVELAQVMKSFMELSLTERLLMGKEGRKMALEVFDEKIINAEILNIIKSAVK